MATSAIPPSTGRRKTRLVRDEPPPHDLLELVRACAAEVDEARSDMVSAALRSATVYAIERLDGRREVLFGVSVFAFRDDRTVAELLERFSASPGYLAVTVGKLRAAGFEVIATGANVDHYDVQLLSGVPDEPAPVVGARDLMARASAVIDLGGPLRANPAYPGTEPPEEP